MSKKLTYLIIALYFLSMGAVAKIIEVAPANATGMMLQIATGGAPAADVTPPDLVDIDMESWTTEWDTGDSTTVYDTWEFVDTTPDDASLDTTNPISGLKSFYFLGLSGTAGAGWETDMAATTVYCRFKLRMDDDNDAPDGTERMRFFSDGDPTTTAMTSYASVVMLCWNNVANWTINTRYEHDDGTGYIVGASCDSGPALTYDKTYHVEYRRIKETADGNNDGELGFRIKNLTDAGSWSSWYENTSRQDYNGTYTGLKMDFVNYDNMDANDIEFRLDDIECQTFAFTD